ncbi:cysteine proteinase [Sistotremastrum niveocremeum HHB9708]|uniref:Cysteine proteinase n=1 Tax=Sistotremastrum niveocremeum HHB9708 TaxID=1314777 RepID=A0A164TJ29_9AGAM|nr:cysteine proteinase [Sistotremastrum niveocremeum HHB9708]
MSQPAALTDQIVASPSPPKPPVIVIHEEDSTCSHLVALFTNESAKSALIKKYKSAVTWAASANLHKTQASKHTAKKRRLASPTCDACHVVLTRPVVCLECSFAGCWHNAHAVAHLRVSDHSFAVEAKTGAIFCASCDDFVYSNILDSLYDHINLSAAEKTLKYRDPGKIKEAYRQWSPDQKDQDFLQTSTTEVSSQGRRGLLNLGQTCAMNTILQSFIHNPLLRNYFLSDKHNYKLCLKPKDCMCCEMDKLFTEIFSGDPAPFGALSILPVMWRGSDSSSSFSEGYAQHDAHEFFISCIQHIHRTFKGSTESSCNCIIHSTFAGALASEIVCGKCRFSSTQVDPMLDISLELKGKDKDSSADEPTLHSCLRRRYTRAEKLPPKTYTCSKCGSNSDATKRLSFRKLPPVLAFQLKRFEHKTADKSSAHKITKPVRFPAQCNLAAFTSFGSNSEATSNIGPDILYDYDLFCVVNHEGAMDNGHYTNFARFEDEWYRFDDDKVTHAKLSQVLASNAYMLFYVKRQLDYHPVIRPSYVVSREKEAQREREREKEKLQTLNREIDDDLMRLLT